MTSSSSAQTQGEHGSMPRDLAILDEVNTCRSIANRCAFVMGPARSGTTILAQVINGSDRAFLTTEAYYFWAEKYPDFRSWYNQQHLAFGNQVSKISYAPNFGHHGEQEWWKWLARAAEHFDVVGDKLAFTNVQLEALTSIDFMGFHETRFFRSKYIFIFRDPVQSILSAANLWNGDPVALALGWAQFAKLWADFIRVFPLTTTVLLEELGPAKVGEIGDFLELDLSESARLLDPREQRRHEPDASNCGEFAGRIAPVLRMIFSEIKESVTMERVFLQADQKRVRVDQGRRLLGRARPEIAVVTTPVGRAWNLAHQLISELLDENQS
jgi:Sulfotransferase family